MRTAEAKVYFHTLGELHREAKTTSTEDAGVFLASERQTPQYQAALLSLKLANDTHRSRGVKEEYAEVIGLLNSQNRTMTLKAYESNSGRRRWNALTDDNQIFSAFMETLNAVRQTASKEDLDVYYPTGIMIYGTHRQVKTLVIEQARLVGDKDLDPVLNRALELRHFTNYRGLEVKIDGVSLSSFAGENFSSKRKTDDKRIKKYIKFFMDLGGYRVTEDLEEIQDNNQVGIAKEYPYLNRNLIIEASYMVRSFHVFPDINPYNFEAEYTDLDPTSRKVIKGITQAVADSKQTFLQFTGRVHNLVFNPELEDSEEMRRICTEYFIHDEKYSTRYLLALMGINTGRELISAYRKSANLAAQGIDPDFYNKVQGIVEAILKRNEYLKISTIGDLDAIVNPKEISGKPEQIFADLKEEAQALSKIPKWEEVDLTEIDIPWEEAGIKTPSAVGLELPTKSPLIFNITLNYQSEYGDSKEIILKVDLGRNGFDWSVLQSPDIYPDLRFRFLKVVKTILTEVHRRIAPSVKTENASASVITKTLRVKPPRPVRFDNPAKLKKQPKQTDTSSIIVLEDTMEHKIRDQVIAPTEEEQDILLKDVPNRYRDRVMGFIQEINSGVKGRLKKLNALGPNGETQYSSVVEGYRILFLEKELSTVLRTHVIRDIRLESEIYGEADQNYRLSYQERGAMKNIDSQAALTEYAVGIARSFSKKDPRYAGDIAAMLQAIIANPRGTGCYKLTARQLVIDGKRQDLWAFRGDERIGLSFQNPDSKQIRTVFCFNPNDSSAVIIQEVLDHDDFDTKYTG